MIKILRIDNILCEIVDYLNNSNLQSLRIISKKFNNSDIICQQLNKNKMIQLQYLNFLFNKKIRNYFENTFFPMTIINKLPIIKFKNHFISGTNYIDNIKKEDMNSGIMIGVDVYYRPFIVIKYKCNQDNIEQVSKSFSVDKDKINVITIFQRYTDSKKIWCKAGNADATSPLLNYSSILLGKNDKKILIKNIINLIYGDNIKYYKYESMIESINEVITEEEIKCKLV